ncbi:alpha/beta hydrolase [uncultured Brachyspira sp.]|uniref:alpha/beta fold hydrolase n=1 Tax=uncultured Brachyspira sp. TaxID=221953 RepID=UPI0025DB593B|nr:alpha/beta hydrolase [uncultured Brachyspira sp.]
MFYHAHNGSVYAGNSQMYYISFGNGNKNLIIVPGLGDGLHTVKGMAIIFSIIYRIMSKEFTVYVFSRKNNLQDGYSTIEMAKDLAEALAVLKIFKADVLGISQGGMIAQYLAIDYPDLVNKLILVSTSSNPNETIKKTVGAWIEMAIQENYKDLIIDTAEKSYSERTLKKYRLIYPLIGIIGKPKSFKRFIIQASSCIAHNSYAQLNKIVCPVLVIGGDSDKIIGTTESYLIAEKISHSELFLYNGLGHAVYEEAKDFNYRCLNFLMK